MTSTLPPYPLQPRLRDRVARRVLRPVDLAERELKREQGAFEDLLRRLGLRTRPVELGPPPGGRVASCTWGDFDRREATEVENIRFFTLGYQLLNRFLRALHAAPFDLREMNRLLEFGCGTARLIRLLRGVEGLKLVGSDLDAETLAWCRSHVPGPTYYRNDPVPPLDFAADGEFDVAIAAAVFSCIRPAEQQIWLREMERVIRPGGIFLCTVLAHDIAGQHLGAEYQAVVEEKGELVLDPDHPLASATAKLTETCDVYMSRQRVDEIFSPIFEIAGRSPIIGQEILVLRRR